MKNDIIKIVALTLFLKVVYFSFAYTISEINPGLHTSTDLPGIMSVFKRNDSYWYEKIAVEGYPEINDLTDLGYSNGPDYKQSEWAFFFLYPGAIRFTGKILNLDFNGSAFILSIIFSISCFLAFYFLCLHVFRKSRKESFFFTVFFMLFPFHYYYSMFYSEALFFTLLALSFILISQKKYLINSLVLIPLTLIRPNGVICLLPLFIYYIETEGGFKSFFNDVKTINLARLSKILYFLPGIFAFILYCIYQQHMTGFYLAFVKAQAGWYKKFMFPFFALFSRSDFGSQFNSAYTVLFMAIAIIVWKH